MEIDAGEVATLAELNRWWAAWVERCYHHRVHHSTGQTPLERWMAGAGALRAAPGPAALADACRWSAQRTVSKTAGVSLAGNTYTVDPQLVGFRVELRYDPEDLTRIAVFCAGQPRGHATGEHIAAHTDPKLGDRRQPHQPRSHPMTATPTTAVDWKAYATAFPAPRSPKASPPARCWPTPATSDQMDSASLLAVVLLGQPSLRRTIRRGTYAALDQRIAVRYHLEPLTGAQTAGYIAGHLAVAGRSDPLFADDAIAAIALTLRRSCRARRRRRRSAASSGARPSRHHGTNPSSPVRRTPVTKPPGRPELESRWTCASGMRRCASCSWTMRSWPPDSASIATITGAQLPCASCCWPVAPTLQPPATSPSKRRISRQRS